MRTNALGQVAETRPGVMRHGGLRGSSDSVANTRVDRRVPVQLDGSLCMSLDDENLCERVQDRAMLGPEGHDGNGRAVGSRDQASHAIPRCEIGIHG